MVRGWVALVVVADVLSLVHLLTSALASAFSDRLPSNVVVGHSAGSFSWWVPLVQRALGLSAVASFVYLLRHR
jgi:hypothetical protein